MGGKLSRTEIEDGKNIAKFKTALLTNEAMENEGYSGESYEGGRGGSSNRGSSYEGGMSGARGRCRNARRNSRGQYSSEGGYSRADAKEEFMEKVYELIDEAPDEHTRKKAERFASEIN